MTEKQVNKARDKVQKEAQKSIENNTTTIGSLLAMATGSGKSKIPIMYAKKKMNKVKSIALIVPTERLRDEDWKEEFKKWDAEDMWINVTRLCYASASKIKGQTFDLVILDECHNITELSAEFVRDNKVKKIIALTATPPEDYEKSFILSSLGIRQTYHLSLDEAVKLGFVAPYKITVVYTELDSVNKNVLAGNKKNPFYTTEYGNYIWLNNTINRMEFEGDTKSSKYQALIFKRMRAIYNLQSKTDAGAHIYKNYVDSTDKTIVFCGSIEQAEKVSKNTYHSKTNDEGLNKFCRDEVNLLSCVAALNEGNNIPGIDVGIILQINSKEKDLVQRIGRTIRYRPGHEAYIWIVCCKGTQDEVWLRKALENINKDIIDFKYFKDGKFQDS